MLHFKHPFLLDKFGSTPLLEAIKNGHGEVASILVDAGANIFTIDDFRVGPRVKLKFLLEATKKIKSKKNINNYKTYIFL